MLTPWRRSWQERRVYFVIGLSNGCEMLFIIHITAIFDESSCNVDRQIFSCKPCWWVHCKMYEESLSLFVWNYNKNIFDFTYMYLFWFPGLNVDPEIWFLMRTIYVRSTPYSVYMSSVYITPLANQVWIFNPKYFECSTILNYE